MKAFLYYILPGIVVALVALYFFDFGAGITYTRGGENAEFQAHVASGLPVNLPEENKVAHIETPERVRAIYMTSWVGSSGSLRSGLVKFINESAINSVVLDIKDYSGVIAFDIDDPLIDSYATDSNRIPDIVEFLQLLHDNDIYVIGRVTVFQDPLLVKTHPGFAVKRKSDGLPWKDKKGLSYLNPTDERVWEYTLAIARESYELGFDEINFDYIRYPSDGNIADIDYNLGEGETRVDNMRKFYEFLHENLAVELGIPISADLFGMTTTNQDDLGIGQNLEDALLYFDFVAPMVYPSHYPSGFHNYKNPADYPYEIIKIAMASGVARAHALGVSVKKLRPWIQDFDLGAGYDANKIQAQIRATYEVGLDSYMSWDPKNSYTRSAYTTDIFDTFYKEYIPPAPPVSTPEAETDTSAE